MKKRKVNRAKSPGLLSLRKKQVRVIITVDRERKFSVKTETKLDDLELEVILEKVGFK